MKMSFTVLFLVVGFLSQANASKASRNADCNQAMIVLAVSANGYTDSVKYCAEACRNKWDDLLPLAIRLALQDRRSLEKLDIFARKMCSHNSEAIEYIDEIKYQAQDARSSYPYATVCY